MANSFAALAAANIGVAVRWGKVGGGFDGSWVAHPGLVHTARDTFDTVVGERPHQITRQRPEVRVRAADLLVAPPSRLAVTMQGLLTNISVALQYLATWVEDRVPSPSTT